ncbi:DUF3054 domain-containing protein [Corynebacterium urealyticum]|uniref:Putative membrane protein n=1 Tax=Corynebacterium urealyticum (strain ATCC 43042 / DSM 7109) TaxID=504474 RepID=B1VED7_CORU7|nr:DUF3054 domain-containing protein [Corynebacterium urealyticum]QQC42341.1 DUF3054 domain-containing protein [Corynebacterium urealyticum]CAQ04126.1 putative membrane protein [Corynebacterium urealyticum DSM 7109]SNV93536.1 putative integral membrane protein [Corynebacterium urealyticum]
MSTAPHNAAAPTTTAPTSGALAPVLDLLALLIFALLARLAHDDGSGFSVLRWLDTAWPFMLGAAIVWVILRATGAGAAGFSLRTGVFVWLGSLVAGLGIWGIRNAAVPHWSFILVATLMSALLLFGWRGIARLRTRKS